MGGICIIRWALFALDLFSHISLKALDIRQSKPFLHEKDELVLAHILVQIPPTEWLMSNFDTPMKKGLGEESSGAKRNPGRYGTASHRHRH